MGIWCILLRALSYPRRCRLRRHCCLLLFAFALALGGGDFLLQLNEALVQFLLPVFNGLQFSRVPAHRTFHTIAGHLIIGGQLSEHGDALHH